MTRRGLLEIGTGLAYPRNNGGGGGQIGERIGPLPTSHVSDDIFRSDGKLLEKGGGKCITNGVLGRGVC